MLGLFLKAAMTEYNNPICICGQFTTKCLFSSSQKSHIGLGSGNTRLSDCLGIIVAAGLSISHAVCWNTCIVLYQCTFTNEHCTLLMLQAAI